MSQALIMRDRSIALSTADIATAQRVMTNGLRGVDEKNQKRWIRFLKTAFSLESGEIVEIGTRVPRSGPFHRYHMAMEQAIFEAQDKFQHFDQFRNWIKVGAGHVDWVAGPKGGVVPLPKSISYMEMEEPAMREFHDSMLGFLRGQHAAIYLWKHLGADKAAEMMETVLHGFDR